MSDNNFYITTPIYYPSGKPHMGHAYSSIIADIFARFKRIENNNVMFLTGTDEHGQKIEREAQKNLKKPKEFCDEISLKFKDLTKTLNLSNDDFIRTTEKRHHKAVNEIWNRLVKSKDIYLSKYSGFCFNFHLVRPLIVLFLPLINRLFLQMFRLSFYPCVYL